jgi:hypothetical protein
MAELMECACSLEAGELVERLDRIARLGSRSCLGAESDGRRHSLAFRRDPGTRTELEAVIAAERRCCPFLDLTLDDAGEQLVLTIDAGPDGEPIAAQLAAAFSASQAT